MARQAVPKRKYPSVAVGGHSAPVDTTGLGPEWAGILTPAAADTTKKAKPKARNPIRDFFRSISGGK